MHSHLLFVILQATFFANTAAAPRETNVAIRAQVIALADPATAAKAQQALTNEPVDVLLPVLIEAMAHDPAYRNETARIYGYQLMHDIGAGRYAEGCNQLLQGLFESSMQIRLNCIYGLRLAPADQMPAVIRDLARIISEPNENLDVIKAAVELVSLFGGKSELVLDAIRPHYARDDVTPSFKAVVALAIMRIGGASEAVLLIRSAKEQDAVALLQALGLFFAESKGLPDAPIGARGELQRFVIDALQSDDRVVRVAAMSSLFPVFAQSLEADVNRREVDPKLRSVLEKVRDHDPDPELRAVAAAGLEGLSQRINAERSIP